MTVSQTETAPHRPQAEKEDATDKTELRRMLNEKQVLEIVPVSPVTLWRMEKAGLFPRGTFISPEQKNLVGRRSRRVATRGRWTPSWASASPDPIETHHHVKTKTLPPGKSSSACFVPRPTSPPPADQSNETFRATPIRATCEATQREEGFLYAPRPDI